MSQETLIKRAWFKTGAYLRESLADYRRRLYSQTQPDLVFLRPQAD